MGKEYLFNCQDGEYKVELPDDVDLPVHVLLRDMQGFSNVIIDTLPPSNKELPIVYYIDPKKPGYLGYRLKKE